MQLAGGADALRLELTEDCSGTRGLVEVKVKRKNGKNRRDDSKKAGRVVEIAGQQPGWRAGKGQWARLTGREVGKGGEGQLGWMCWHACPTSVRSE